MKVFCYMATNLPSCFFIQFLEQLVKFLVNFTLLKYVKSQRSYGFLITKELMFGFQISDLKDHFSDSLIVNFLNLCFVFEWEDGPKQRYEPWNCRTLTHNTEVLFVDNHIFLLFSTTFPINKYLSSILNSRNKYTNIVYE